MLEKDAFSKAKATAFRILSYRNHSERELTEKLMTRGIEPSVIDKVILCLKGYGMLDDLAFTKGYIKQRLSSKPIGKSLLALELKQKGIKKSIVEDQLGNISDEEEFLLALKLAKKKENSLGNFDKAKIFAYLRRKGFRNEIVFRVCHCLKEDKS